MKISLLLYLALILGLGGCALAPRPVTGELAGDIFWSGTVALRGDVMVDEGATLHIAPGTHVLFLPPEDGEDLLTAHPFFPGSELIVYGRILARGTPQAPITFAAANPLAPAGSWGAINLRQSPEAIFAYCRFTQADSAIHSFDSHVRITQSLFEDNLVAVRFNTSDIHVEHNLIRNNGAGIRFHFGAPVIRHNELRDNDRGFFFTSHPRDYLIEQNNILDSRDYAVVFGEEVPDDVLMPGNYWGTTDTFAIEQSLFDGARLEHLGRLIYQPLAETSFPDAGPAWIR